MKTKIAKLLAVLALIAAAIGLQGCVGLTAGNTHVWAGLSTNGVGFAYRSYTVNTNGTETTNGFTAKFTVPFNISGAIEKLFISGF